MHLEKISPPGQVVWTHNRHFDIRNQDFKSRLTRSIQRHVDSRKRGRRLYDSVEICGSDDVHGILLLRRDTACVPGGVTTDGRAVEDVSGMLSQMFHSLH